MEGYITSAELTTELTGYLTISAAQDTYGSLNNPNTWTGTNTFTKTLTAYALNAPSDYRIKKNKQPLDESFTIKNLNPVIYDNILTQHKDIGLIAHELQEYYPELVTGEKDGKEYQKVNYIGLIPILINEIKNLHNKFENLEKNFEDFKTQKCKCKK